MSCQKKAVHEAHISIPAGLPHWCSILMSSITCNGWHCLNFTCWTIFKV